MQFKLFKFLSNMQVMRQFLPLEFEGPHALGATMATVAWGMSSEMRKRYITSTTAELKTPAGLRMRTRRRRNPRRTHKKSYTFGVDAEFPC